MEIVKIRVPQRYLLDDGLTGVVDVGDLAGQGVFSAWLEPGAFEDVSIGSGGELVWASGVDLWADALYLRLTGETRSPSVLVRDGRCVT